MEYGCVVASAWLLLAHSCSFIYTTNLKHSSLIIFTYVNGNVFFFLCREALVLAIWLFGKLHIHPTTYLSGWIECMYSMWGAICQHCIEFFSFFFPPPGRLSPIISTFHVCKAGAPWGILCPLHPLLCWGHLALPVQPLCRCLYSQLPCICPRPLLQPVYQPGLYSRYSFIYKAT